MSAVAGTERGAVVNWAGLPSLGHVVPPSGHAACTSLAAAWGECLGIGGNLAQYLGFKSKSNSFSIRRVLMLHVDSWQLGSSRYKKLPLGA